MVKRTIEYPIENTVQIQFENLKEKVKIEKITLNGIDTNPYYNTSFSIAGSDTILTSVHTIEKDGTFTLVLDDLYIRSHRSNDWHCSKKKKDFIFHYEFTRSSFTDVYRDRNHKGFTEPFIPCFGCSFTYGQGQSDTDTWPYLLSQKTGKNFLNLGVGGSGIDGIYNNLKLLYQKHNFKEVVILFPNFERRIVRAKIDDQWIRLHTSVNLFERNEPYHFYTNNSLRHRWKENQKKIVKDVDNRYSKKFLSKIIQFCDTNKIKLHCSSHNPDVYDHLKLSNYVNLLIKFTELNRFKERADDGSHPHRKHYQYWVDEIAGNW